MASIVIEGRPWFAANISIRDAILIRLVGLEVPLREPPVFIANTADPIANAREDWYWVMVTDLIEAARSDGRTSLADGLESAFRDVPVTPLAIDRRICRRVS